MIKVKVDIECGEATRVSPIAFQAIAGSWNRSLIPAAIGMATGIVLASILEATITFFLFSSTGAGAASLAQIHQEKLTPMLQVVAAILGWKLGEMYFGKQHLDRFLRGLAARGAPRKLATTFTIAPDGFGVDSDRGTMLARWHSIIEIWCVPSHWLIQADCLTLAVPRRAFVSAEEERGFVTKLAGHLTDEARQRSSAAISVVIDADLN